MTAAHPRIAKPGELPCSRRSRCTSFFRPTPSPKSWTPSTPTATTRFPTRNSPRGVNADADKDGAVTKKEGATINVQDWDRIRKADSNKDGLLRFTELMAAVDFAYGPEWRRDHHPSHRNQQAWSQAIQTVQRLGGADKRISKLEAGKQPKLHASFDEIDSDKDERIKLAELFHWMASQ